MDCNWGILGPGFIATHAIIPAIQEVSNSRILAVASNNEERSREVALRFGIERFYSDYQALLDDPSIYCFAKSPASRMDNPSGSGKEACTM